MSKHRTLLLLVVSALALLLGLPSVAQAQYGGTQGFIIDPAQGYPGDTVNLLGTGCGANSPVTFTIVQNGQVIATTTANADPDGSFFVNGVVIPNLPPGVYDVRADCGSRSLVAQMTILARPPVPSRLAFSGSNSLPTVKIAVLLIGMGALAIVAVRRRRRDGITDQTGVSA